ncbi:MAG TPA: archease, partial [Deltaproteobacteria bacterium]|nr:archease [Deltaproteobacteria bacterium]
MTGNYRAIEHTGDLGVELEAETLEELFATASQALTDTLVEAEKVAGNLEAEWSLEAETLESLLVRHLQEILYQFDYKSLIFNDFKISIS